MINKLPQKSIETATETGVIGLQNMTMDRELGPGWMANCLAYYTGQKEFPLQMVVEADTVGNDNAFMVTPRVVSRMPKKHALT